MKIKRIITGSLEENCYVLIKENDCLVIDPGDDFYKIKEEIKDLNLVGILITHNHFDHVGALTELLEYKNVKIYDYNLEEKEYEINNFKFKYDKFKITKLEKKLKIQKIFNIFCVIALISSIIIK